MIRSLLVAGLIGVATIASGQQFTAGPIMGANYSSIGLQQSFTSFGKNYQYVSNSAGLGLLVGAFGEMSWERFFIQPQLTFSQNNAQLHFDTEHGAVTQKLSIHRLQIPIMAGYKLNNMFSAFAGPMVNTFIDGSLSPANQDMFASFTGNMPRVAMGYQLGAGITVNRSTFGLQFRGNFEDQGFDATYRRNIIPLSAQTQVLQVSYSYRMNLKKDRPEEIEEKDIFFPPKEITVSE
jgi:hypothetical protein